MYTNEICPAIKGNIMIDLHTHTNESDGSVAPAELLRMANEMGLEALAITDHDTLAGYDQAVALAGGLELELVCGIELSTGYRGRSVHLLGYFLNSEPTDEFRQWIVSLQISRHRRNQRLVARLQSMGFDITLEEVMMRGKKLPGRPHFAAILVEKGYVMSTQEAFDRYLDEAGACYVSRDEPSLAEGIRRIADAGGLPSLPHPSRLTRDPMLIEQHVRHMREIGLRAIEVYHSDHSVEETSLYASLAQRFSLAITGGSDFHGAAKPHVALGTGMHGDMCIPMSVLMNLRQAN